MKIKKGDTVKIITGKDKNKTGKVLKVLVAKGKLLVEGLNLTKKHVKPKNQGEKGQTISVSRPVDVSNAMILCPGCGRAARIAYKEDENSKLRICRRCGTNLS
ncbi:MAG: 50S ribosomal protein L24 [Candidatus Wolfebacteria bacterium]|nr:50S ribosomal protein L24 [Candidatus Wolfebacteria bacterium]